MMNFLTNVQGAQWILNLAFNSMVIVGIGWVLARIFRQKAAPLRSGLILMILIILMLLPILSLQTVIPHLIPFQITLPISISSSVETNVNSYLTGIEGITPETLSPITKKKEFLPFISDLFWIRIINGFGIIWGLGFLVCLFRIMYGTKVLIRFKNGLVEINDVRMTRVRKSLENTFGKQIRFKIFLSDTLTTPIMMGLFRPIVVLPHSLYIKWNENTVKGILLHELAHIYHKDNLTGVLQRLATFLNWWNPLVYNLSADFSRAREEISDNHVLLENNSRDYAECLICLAENKSLISRLPVFTSIISPYIPLNDRIKYILSKERRMETHLKKSSFFLIFVISVFLVGACAGQRLAFTKTNDSDPTSESIQEKSTKDEKISPPKLVKKVEPVYPELAINAHIEGTVVVEAATDIDGRVQRVKIISSVPLLDQAAVDAIRQWIYEPMIIDGKPRGVIFTIACQFQLGEKVRVDVKTINPVHVILPPSKAFLRPPPPPPKQIKEDSVRAVGDIKPPRLIKRVDPIYPQLAEEARIEGVVIAEVKTGIYGRVQNVKILRSIPLLDQAAMDAVYQWVYEPFVLNGKPRGIIFTVTVVFERDKEIKSQYPVRVSGDIKTKLIKRVDPIYPEGAKEAHIEGVVILEVRTGIYGRVQNVKILRSIPLLDQAAMDAVYQWVYEPFVLDGKPQGAIYTATVIFKLK